MNDGCKYFSSCLNCGFPRCASELTLYHVNAHRPAIVTPTEMGRIMHDRSPRFAGRGHRQPSPAIIRRVEASIMHDVAAERGVRYQTVWRAWQTAKRLHLPVRLVDVAEVARRRTLGHSKRQIARDLCVSEMTIRAAEQQAIDDSLLVAIPVAPSLAPEKLLTGIARGHSLRRIARDYGVPSWTVYRQAAKLRPKLSNLSISLVNPGADA